MELREKLSSILPRDRIRARTIDRIAYANDASYFRLVPQAVVQPRTNDEISSLFRFSQGERIPLVFRAGGTSLSGQAVTDGILVDISKHWDKYELEDGGERIRFQPGIVAGFLNNVLHPHRRRLGPDPASIDAAMMGGILANNSSGMCCGVTENAYRTIESMTIVFPNGFQLDTGAQGAEEQFALGAPDIAKGLLELKARLLAAPADPIHPGEKLADRVRRRYQMKNNNGYLLNAFLDFDAPLDILTHLIIGSEGTLGFISEAVLKTLPDYRRKLTGLLNFRNIRQAAAAIYPLKASGARALEIMDRASIKSIENLPGAPRELKDLPESAASILVEYQAETGEEIDALKKSCSDVLSSIATPRGIPSDSGQNGGFTEDPVMQAALWKLRKGIIPSVGAVRTPQTTLLTEDVVFPVDRLAEAVTDLQGLFKHHGYDDAVIFGHAKDGNLHFLLAQSFGSDEQIRRFDSFTRDLVKLVSGKYDGALKAEHGTGRNMAPFVEAEWGTAAYEIMRDIKSLFDPDGILAPGVIISGDSSAHVNHTKMITAVGPEVDKCIECGFCEPKCPSRWLTMTPRQRIVAQRETSRLRGDDLQSASLKELVMDFSYDGVETCALDGLCASACPVGINTGDLIKRIRAESVKPSASRLAGWIEKHFSFVEESLGNVVQLGHFTEKILGAQTPVAITKSVDRFTGMRIPKWNSFIPYKPASRTDSVENGDYIYFPSCISRQLGKPGSLNEKSLMSVFVEVSERAGISLKIPDDIGGVCCGMPFGSKGFPEQHKAALGNALFHFWDWSNQGEIPIVIDTTSCTQSLQNWQSMDLAAHGFSANDQNILKELKLLDGIEYIHDALLPRLNITALDYPVALHPNCSARKLGLDGKLKAIAQRCSISVTVPMNLGCCAFAGDRGLLYPELTSSATHREASEIADGDFEGYYSSNIPCEIGMSSAVGETYKSIVYLVERASR